VGSLHRAAERPAARQAGDFADKPPLDAPRLPFPFLYCFCIVFDMKSRHQLALERAIVEALMKCIQPVMENLVVAFRQQLPKLLQEAAEQQPRRSRGQMGQTKSCRVCKLKGARNDAALPSTHTQEDHRRWKASWPASAGRGQREDAA
jgi:hypothetical protein